jgi:hypothetical protein
MNIEERIDCFLAMDYKKRLDSWGELLSLSKDFIDCKINNKELAKRIAEAILNHRLLMGSSKAYESAFEIDTDLLYISIPIARIAYGKSKHLIEFLNSGIYYSDVLPNRFNKTELEKEIMEIEQSLVK